MTRKTTISQEARKLFLMAASLALAFVLLGGTRAFASETTVTTDQGTFTIGYGGYGYNKYDAPTVIGYTGSESDVTLPTATVTTSSGEEAVTILGEAFKSNTAITSVTIPEGYTSIGISALSGCSGLTTVTIPSTLQTVGATAFDGCTKLTTVNFTENQSGTLKFMNKVFNGCTALESITLPVQTTSVYDNGNIFTGCTALKNIAVSSGNAKYITDNGSLYAKNDDGTALTLCTYANVPAELTIPDTAGGLPVTAIGPMGFQKNTTLTAVTIPASMTTVNRLAFDECSNLKTVTLLCESAPTLGSYAFTGLASGSTIYVANETVAAAITSSYYTSANTTIKVGAPVTTTEAAVSIAAAGYADGKLSFNLYLDHAAEVSAVMLQLTFDAAKVGEGTVTVADNDFDNNNFAWKTDAGTLTAVLQFGKLGDDGNLTYTERTKLATITLPVQAGVSGEVTATLAQAMVAGAGAEVGGAVNADITTGTATGRILSYDVNGDGTIDLKDIAEAQRYYQARSGDANWTTAQAADVNGDGTVDAEDYIALFRAVVEAMGW